MDQVDKLDIIKQIYSTIEKPDIWRDLLVRISDTLGSSHAFIASRLSVDHSPSCFVAHGFESGHFETYQDHFYKVDWWTQGLALQSGNRFHPSHLVCNDNAFRHSEIYTDFAKPAAIRNSIGCLLAKPDSELITELAFMSGSDSNYYSKTQIEMANSLLPHIEHALEISQRMREKKPSETQHSLLDILSDAIFVCDHKAELLYFNASAQALLSHSKLFRLPSHSSGRLIFDSSAVDAKFHLALSASLCANLDSRCDRFYASDKQSVYRITLKPWFHQQLTPIGQQTIACSLVMVQACASQFEIVPQDIMLLFSLTLAEAQVCRLLCSGALVDEIAMIRHATPNTIRQQIKSCLAKTNTRNQAELVGKLIRSVTLG